MSSVEINEQFLAKIAGWDVIKQARMALAGEKVLSSAWMPPVLKGVVQEGSTSYRSGLVIKDSIDIENLCPCRTSRAWGAICMHSVAVGLHYLRSKNPPAPQTKEIGKTAAATPGHKPASATPPAKSFRRIQRGTDGLEAELFVLFPPNLSEALKKGKVMLYFEVETARGRGPLQSLLSNGVFQFSQEDAGLLDLLEEIAGDTPGMLIAGPAELARILDKLAGHPRVTLGKNSAITVAPEPVRLSVRATLRNNGQIELGLAQPITLDSLILGGKSLWRLKGLEFQKISLPGAARGLMQGQVILERSQIPLFLSSDWETLNKTCDVQSNFSLEDFSLVYSTPGIVLDLAGGLANLTAKLHFEYGGKRLTAGSGGAQESVWMPDPASPTRYGTRDLQAEQAAIGRLQRNGFTGPHQDGTFQLAGQNSVLSFFARDYYKLGKEWKVTLEERLERSTAQNLERIEPQFEVTSSGVQWFDLEVAYNSSGGEKFSPAEIQRLIRSGQSHTRLRNGKFAIIDTGAVEELQEVLLDCSPQQNAKGYRIQNRQAGFLGAALNENPSWKVKASDQWKKQAEGHNASASMHPPFLGKLEEVLRPYQKHGVGWLEFLRRNNFGGILADEMGLGKTLQTLAFIKTVRERTAQSERRPSLIVCPTSLVFNWVAEAQKFTPELKVLALNGPRRHDLFAEIGSSDMVVTSYALIRRDSEKYQGVEFDTVILDEAQHIKNRQTQNAQAVKAIRSKHRVVLTGTPIENSVLDLWSIFDFLMPGYLGSATDFKERYEVPITKEKNPDAQKRLARRIRPFLLRRLKRDVAKDLPEKIEQVSYCELTSEQQEVYQQVLEASRQEISNAVEKGGMQKSRMVVLTALLRLRQVCCDLRLLKLEKASETNSGKLELFQELLQEVLDGGHRVLVFSQFVEMLHILKSTLDAQNVEYSYLDGSTPDRGKVVMDFQSKPIPVFLISLKAGGVGLNLSAADTVVHFDPWWNPAVEAQATDRAHRIGQTNVVTSYKLITRGTVEEKILQLQNRKREITDLTLSGEEQLANNLSWEELQSLFE